jgi:NAD(P)-dependent dehydrogenase (short-subunit alcohol dehydrogenase family)
MKLDRSVSAVVTGATSGLGAAVVERLAARGVRVALFGRNEAAGARLAERLGAIFCRVDITSDASVEAGFDWARAQIGQERILVNCAGTARVRRAASRNRAAQQVERFPACDFERVVQVNLIGTFRCITKSAAGMLDLEPIDHGVRGAIVNTASIAAQDGQIGQSAYAASKAGVVGMTLPLMRDFMADGIRVNAIMPGIFDTPMLDHS